MDKIDLTKKYKDYYSAKSKPELVDFGKVLYLTITGKGEPAGEEFQQKTQALYPVAYDIKKLCKVEDKDFAVPKLEGLWWADNNKPFLSVPRSQWQWKLLIRMPDFIKEDMQQQSIKEVAAKKKISQAQNVKLENIDEGKLVSMMHVGPYATEAESIELMNKFISEHRLSKNGLHHEIYPSDPNKTAPEKMKTILRQPVK
jgi:hypothetical protein